MTSCSQHVLHIRIPLVVFKVLQLRPHFSSVKSFSHVWHFVTPWPVARQASLSITSTLNLLKLMSIESVMPSNYLRFCHPFSSGLQSFPASGSFPMSVLHISWPKYWSFSFSISSSKEYLGLISFWIDWFDLIATQGTVKSILQHHFKSINSLVLSFLYSPTLNIHTSSSHGKKHSLTRRTFVSRVMSLFFNMLSRLVIVILVGSKCLLISWLQSPSAVILDPPPPT